MVPWLPALWVGALDPQGPIAWPQAWIESLALWLLALCDALPGTSLILPERPVWWIFGVSALALAALAVARRGDRQRHCERAACAGLALTLVPWTCAPRELEVFALDVGHGTCVVARAPGLPLVVFDAGTTTRHGLERSALRPLLSRFDAGAGLLVVSHLDRDHSAAVPWLARRGLFARTAGAWPADLTHDAPHVDIATTPGAFEGETRAGAGARTDAARWRLTRGSLERGNEGSRNLELTWNGARVLLCGDATGDGFARLVDERVTRGPFDLVLLPHHGRHGVGTQRLLDELAPREVWLSSETPAPILSELERRGVPWRGTFATGPLGPWRAHDPPPRPLPLVTTAVRSASRTTRERRPRRDVKNSATHTSVRSARGLDERPTRRTRHTRRRCRSLASTTAHAPR
jgi:beta-lactamase superfamily II metal-dependent hydrolase